MKKIIFVGFTPYHLVNSMYYTMQIREKIDCESILIWQNFVDYKIDFTFMKQIFTHIYILPEFEKVNKFLRQFRKLCYIGYFFPFSEIGRYLSRVNEKIILCCFSDAHALTYKIIEKVKNKKECVVLIEEGLGVYEKKQVRQYPLRTKIINFLLGIKEEKFIGINKNIDTVILKHPEWLKDKKFLSCNVLQQNNIFLDLKFIDRLNFIKDEIEPYKSNKKLLLWLGDPVEGCGGKKEEEIQVINELANCLQKTHIILIKPHPGEELESYKKIDSENVRLLELPKLRWIPIELIVSYLQFHTVITTISSAAFNIYQMKNRIQIIYVYNMMKNFRFDQGIMQGILENENIYCPFSVNEIVEIVEKEDKIPVKEILNKNKDQDVQYIIQKINGEENG